MIMKGFSLDRFFLLGLLGEQVKPLTICQLFMNCYCRYPKNYTAVAKQKSVTGFLT